AFAACDYRLMRCGSDSYGYFRERDGMWCQFSLNSMESTPFVEAKAASRLHDDGLTCHLSDDKKKPHTVTCLRESCSTEGKGSISKSEVKKACSVDVEMKKREYSYTRTGSVWGYEAMKHFIRNYIVTLIIYCYFMMQARRAPMKRMEIEHTWKNFMKAINPKEDDDKMIEVANKREKQVYERYKSEGRAKPVKIEH
ncbi:hypothetical protein PFISCL1PPCAC_19537, partial [Pristionchus fissidentatus]